MSNLKSLQLQDVEADDDDELLPVRSATTLSHLAILSAVEDIICWRVPFGETVGNMFTNLTSLFLRFLDESLCKDLAGSNFRLTEFRAVIACDFDFVNDDSIARLFSSPTCRDLRQLSLLLLDAEAEFGAILVEIITTKLPDLDELTLGLAVYNGWYWKFARLHSLKSLTWYRPVYDWNDGDGNVLGLKPHITFQEAARITENKIQDVFKEFSTKPLVNVWILHDHEYDDFLQSDSPFYCKDGVYVAAPPKSQFTSFSGTHYVDGECSSDELESTDGEFY